MARVRRAMQNHQARQTRRFNGACWIARVGGTTERQKISIEPAGFAYRARVAHFATEVGVIYETAGSTQIVLVEISVPNTVTRSAND